MGKKKLQRIKFTIPGYIKGEDPFREFTRGYPKIHGEDRIRKERKEQRKRLRDLEGLSPEELGEELYEF